MKNVALLHGTKILIAIKIHLSSITSEIIRCLRLHELITFKFNQFIDCMRQLHLRQNIWGFEIALINY